MRSLNLDYDTHDFEKLKAEKEKTKLNWERFIFSKIMGYEMQK